MDTSYERRRTSSSSEYHTDHVTNKASGAGTSSYEFNDSTSEIVHSDSSVNSTAKPETTAATVAAAASVSAPAGESDVVFMKPVTNAAEKADMIAAITDKVSATPEPAAKSDAASRFVKTKPHAVKFDETVIAKASGTPVHDVPSIDVQAATPAASVETDDPLAASGGRVSETAALASSARAAAEKPSVEAQKEAAHSSPSGVSAPEILPPAEPVTNSVVGLDASAPLEKESVPVTTDAESWGFDEVGANVQEDPVLEKSSEIFNDAVVIPPASGNDSDEDDKPLALLAPKQPVESKAVPSSKPEESADVPPATTTRDDAVKSSADAPVDTVAVGQEPKQETAGATAAPQDGATKLITPETAPDTSAPKLEMTTDLAVASTPETSEQQPAAAEPLSDAKQEEPKVGVEPTDIDSKAGDVKKETSDSASKNPEDGANKPELHLKIEKSNANAPEAVATPDVEQEAGSSVPKHMLDVDADGPLTTESEMGSRPESPVAQKTVQNQPKKKTKAKKSKKL